MDPAAAAAAFGEQLPTQLRGESSIAHRRRVLATIQRHSPEWAGVDLRGLAGAALDAAERQIVSAAAAAARDASTVPPGTLRQVVETDAAGRRITKFYGDPEDCWAPFKQPRRVIAAWPGARRIPQPK